MKNLTCLTVLLLLLVVSCKSKKSSDDLLNVAKDQELLDQYFMAATAGMISSSDDLKYVLKEPLTDAVQESDLQDVISLSPAVSGKVTLSNHTVLTFTPAAPLKSGETYTVSLNLKSLDSKKYENIQYQIKTFAQDIKVDREGFEINDDGTISLFAGIKTADKVTAEQIKTCFVTPEVTAEVTERSPTDFLAAFRLPKSAGRETKILWNGQSIGAEIKGEIPFFDYDAKSLSVVHTHHQAVEKTFNIYFSQRLNKQQDLTGLLKVKDDNVSYKINNHILTIFLSDVRDADKINISLNKNIKSVEGKSLSQDQTFEISTFTDKPDAQFVSDGNYFPSEGDFKIPIKTRAINALRIVVIEIKQENVLHYLAWQSLSYSDYYNIRMYGKPVYDQIVPLNDGLRDNEGWTVHGIDLTAKIKKNPGSIYHISMDFGPENTTIGCKNSLTKYKVNSKIPNNEFFELRDNYYEDSHYYYEDYNWEENADPCKLAYYMYRDPVQRMFICSDYAVIAKKAGNTYHIALSKLLDLSQVSDAEVTLYSLQAEKIASAKTNSNGFVDFKNIKGEAAVLKIVKGTQQTYLALDPNQSNSLTEFDIAGERSEIETEFFAYTDRDVWRPGDSIYVDLMINKAQTTLPAGMPVVMTFFDTENMVVDEQIRQINTDKNLIHSFTLHTSVSAKTGLYRCVFQIGPKKVRKNIRIETIKPNTAEVLYTFTGISDNTIYTDKISGSIQVKYLTGFEVGNAKVTANARVRKISQPFGDYRDYNFDVLDNEITDNNISILNTQTNDNGTATFAGSQDMKNYNCPLNVSIETETALPGGGTNKEGKSIKVYPFATYIGAKRKDGTGWAGNHTFTENIEVSLVNVNNRGKLHNQSNNISYQIQKHVESWWVDKYRLRSAGNFVNAEYWQDVDDGSVSITGKGKITLPKGSLDKGAYKMTITDESSGHRTQTYFTVYDGVESIPGAQPYITEFESDKDAYKTGETIKLKMPEIEDAKVLVSIERGNRVIEQTWHTITKGNNIIQLKSNDDWSPNIYIHATIMQKYKQEANDLPLRMYGIRHVKMDAAITALKPVATLPDKLESNKTYNFTVSESEGRPMEYTIALVDEGLLNLTGFQTPDPYKHFNGKFPLLVKTWDVYQYLINYFKGKFAGIISIGGDDAYHPDAIAEINRFKPVAIHMGPFKAGKGGKMNHTIHIPNYIGRVRLMIVACNDKNFGKLDKAIPVKNPLMIQTQFPRSLNVSDKLLLPVTILKDEPGIQSATLTAKVDPTMIKGLTASKSIAFGGKNQVLQSYNIEVLNKTGKLDVEMGISSGNKKMTETTSIPVHYPNSYESTVNKQIIESGSKATITAKPKGYADVFSSSVLISGLKVPDFTRYAGDLVEYPYGCLEQSTSVGFSQLYLDKIIELDPAENKKRMENLQASMHKISRMQQSNGKFNYWEGSYYHAWSDIYAGNFLTEMKRLGYLNHNSDMLSRWLDAHVATANNWALAESSSSYVYESESLAQAFRMFVLAKGGKPAKSAMNRFVTSNKSVNALTWWLVAGSFQLSGYDSKAKEYVSKAENLQKNQQNYSSYESFGDPGRDKAMIVEILSYIDSEKKKLESYYDQMVESLNAMSWTSTQTKGYAFIAAFKYFGKALNITGKIDYTVSGLNGGAKSYNHSSFEPKLIKIDKSAFGKPVTIQNKGKGRIYIYQMSRFIDNTLIKEGTSSNLNITTDYYNATTKQSGNSGAKQGDDIIITIRVNNPAATALNDLALNLKMPAGWELINPRLYETEIAKNKGNFTYQDFKDDRVYTFFGLRPGGTEVFNFKAKAAFSGDFFMPAVSCEHMYNGDIYARMGTGRVSVIR
ncbi:MAG: hypothetical protein IPK35_21965 [Saprospiraceae bacterium]|nr:hypothetical protein [Saprospiraceae bacterium]